MPTTFELPNTVVQRGDGTLDGAAVQRDFLAIKRQLNTLSYRRVAARGIRTTTFNINNAIPGTTPLPFDSVDYETHPGMVNLNGNITIPVDGVYQAAGFFTYGFASVTTDLMIINTVSERRGELRIAASAGQIMMVHAQWRAVKGEVVRLMVGQNSGGVAASGAGSSLLPWYFALARVG